MAELEAQLHAQADRLTTAHVEIGAMYEREEELLSRVSAAVPAAVAELGSISAERAEAVRRQQALIQGFDDVLGRVQVGGLM